MVTLMGHFNLKGIRLTGTISRVPCKFGGAPAAHPLLLPLPLHSFPPFLPFEVSLYMWHPLDPSHLSPAWDYNYYYALIISKRLSWPSPF